MYLDLILVNKTAIALCTRLSRLYKNKIFRRVTEEGYIQLDDAKIG